ncbi:MAG: metallophosphoesterase [Deltaproteobacteria bacterium]|nr:MAG: metallophosphoesterase [Deltaproteobacteria bacterium]
MSRGVSEALWRVGVVSDTHGLVRPELSQAFRGADLIVHAGDIGSQEVLEVLEAIAPVYAVRGNVDLPHRWAQALPDLLDLEVGAARLRIVHRRQDLETPLDDCDAVIFGHSHQPEYVRRRGRLHLNPGSAGPRRFSLPVTCALLWIRGRRIRGRIVPLLHRSR